MMTVDGSSDVNVKVGSVRSSRQEIILDLNFKETEEFKDKEINIKNQKFIVLIENMVEKFKANKPLPSSDVISKSSSQLIYYADYPIQVPGINIYIPKGESKGAGKTMSVTSSITKPVTAVLMIVAMPAAITLEKVLQSLDYLNYMNVEDLPRNVRAILQFTSEGSLFGNINFFGEFYKFDDGDDTSEEQQDGNKARILRRILIADKAFCRTHMILSKEGLSCNGWNNTGLYFIQLCFLVILMALLKILGKWARTQEKKQLNKSTILSKIDLMFEDINDLNSEVKLKRKCLHRVIFFVENIFSFEFFMNYFLGIQMDIMIGAWVGLRYARFESFASVLSIIISLVVVLFYGAVTVLISINV